MLKLKSRSINFKNWFKSCSFKKKLLLGGGILTILILIYLLIALLAVSPVEIRLAELKNSWENEKICHESCALRRAEAEEAVVGVLMVDFNAVKESRLAKRLKIYFLDEKLSAEFRSELVKILRRAYGPAKPPLYLKDYLTRDDGNPAVQATIINSYGAAVLNQAALNDKGGDKAGVSPLNYYFTLLTGDRDLVLKLEAIRALSNYPDKINYFSTDQLAAIEKLALDPATDSRLRPSLILLLTDYYPLFPKETAAILKMIYGEKNAGDEISRAFAADILNRFGAKGDKWPIPAVSDAAWDEYYNN